MFAPFLPFTCEKLNGFFGYKTPLFGEPYIETRRRGVEAERIKTRRETQSARSAVQETGRHNRGFGTGGVGEVIRLPQSNASREKSL